MDTFRGRPRQRTTPHPKIRHTSVTPDYGYFIFTPNNTSARHRAKEQSFPYRRQRNTAPQFRPVKNWKIQRHQNRESRKATYRERSRPGPSQHLSAPQNDRYEKLADPYRSPYHDDHFGSVAGPYRPPGLSTKGKNRRKRTIRESRPNLDDTVVHEHAPREYSHGDPETQDGDDFPHPQRLDYQHARPSFNNNYTYIPSNQRPRTVSFNFHGGRQDDVYPPLGDTYLHLTKKGRKPTTPPPSS